MFVVLSGRSDREISGSSGKSEKKEIPRKV